jgi:hypothetical protein
MSDRISLQCPGCGARLRAARALLGQVCPCPRCKQRVVVRLAPPSDADIALIPEEASHPTHPVYRARG